MTPAARARRLLVLWACGLTPLLVWTASFDMFEQPKQLALKLAATALVLLAAARGEGFAVPRPAAGPLALGLGLALVSTFVSPLPRTAWFGEYTSYQGWLHLAALAALLARATTVVREGGAGRLVIGTTLAGVAAAGYALLQACGLDPAVWTTDGPLLRTFSTAGNPMFLGHLLATVFPLAVGLAAGTGRWRWRAAAILVFAGLLSSGSRAPLLAAVLGSAIALRRPVRAAGPRVGASLLAGCGAALVLGAWLLPADHNPFPALATRFADLAHGREGRFIIWAGAGRLLARAPLLGSGLDSFATLHPQVQTAALWDVLWRSSPEKAHHDLLQAAATAGLPATGALLWLAAVLVAAGRRARSGPAAGAAGSLAAFAVCSCFGFATCGPEAVALVAASLLLADRPHLILPRPLVIPAAAVLAGSLALHAGWTASEVALKRVARTGVAERELALHAPWAQSLLRAGDAAERSAFGTTLDGASAAVVNGRAQATIAALYRQALAANPLHPYAWSDVARWDARYAAWSNAESGYRRARELAPLDAYLALEQAQMQMAAGRAAHKKSERTRWFEEAEWVLKEAAAPYPTFAEPVGMLGYLALVEGRAADAEALLARSLDLDWHGNAGAAYAAASNLAALLHQAGREAEAQAAFARAQAFAAAAPGRL